MRCAGIRHQHSRAESDCNHTLTYDYQTWAVHHVIGWNISQNNVTRLCGSASNPYDTDGKGTAMDTFNRTGVSNVLYPNQTLVAFNVAFGNAARGLQVFRSVSVTVFNNAAYDHNLESWSQGLTRGEISNAAGLTINITIILSSLFLHCLLQTPAARANYDVQLHLVR